MSTETVGPDVPEPAVPPQPDAAPAPPAVPPAPTVPATPAVPAVPAVPAQAPEPAAETLPAEALPAVAGTAVEAVPAPEPGTPADDTTGVPTEVLAGSDEPRPARKLSTGRLLLAAVLLGPVVGAGVGYAIQASRPATPLPALKAVKLAYPADRVDPQVLAAGAPQPLNIDGDLRDLLLKRPDGTEEWETEGNRGGWLDAAEYAESYGNSPKVFSRLLSNGFRRAAVVSWKTGETKVRIRLIQYRPDSAVSAIGWSVDSFVADTDAGKIPGNPQSTVVIGNKPDHYAQSTEQYYFGAASARKGTLIMEIEVFAPSKVDKAMLEDIAKRQWERIA